MKVALANKRQKLVPNRRLNQSYYGIRKLPGEGNYTVLDTGCDIACLGAGWAVIAKRNRYVLNHEGNSQQLVDCIATIVSLHGSITRTVVVRVNNALHYPGKQESLLPPDQMRWNGITVNDTAKAFGGTQSIITKELTIPLYWDGKTYFIGHASTKTSDKSLPRVELTGKTQYNPRNYAMQHAVQQAVEESADLSTFLDRESPVHTGNLQAHLLDGLCVEDEESVTMRRSYLWDAERHIWKAHQLAEWKLRLASNDTNTVKKTFLATTQLVPSVRHENEQDPKDYHVARFPMLQCRRLKEAMHCDVVEHKVGKKTIYSLMCYCAGSKIKAIYELGERKTSQATLQALYEFIRDFGCPAEIKSDYANQLKNSNKWKTFTRILVTKLSSSEPHKHNQNYAERAWQDIQKKAEYISQRNVVPDKRKTALFKHLCDAHNHTALSSLNWITPMQAMTGEAPDISFLRYYFYQPVWYLEGPAQQPDRKWLKGRFLGISWGTGDQMCYNVCPDSSVDTDRVVPRSIIVARHPDENVPHQILKEKSDYYFPTPAINVGAIQPNTDTAELEGRNKQKRKRKSKSRAVEDNPEVESDDEPELETVEDGNNYEAELRKQYLEAAEDEERKLNELSLPTPEMLDQGTVLEIVGHKRRKGTTGTNGITFNVKYPTGKRINAVSYDDVHEDAPLMLAEYILNTRSTKEDETLCREARKTRKSWDRFVELDRKMRRRHGVKILSNAVSTVISACPTTQVKCRRTVVRRNKPLVQSNSEKARAFSESSKSTKSNSPNKRKSNAMGTIKYGVYIPKNVQDALREDEKNGNTLWKDAIKKEVDALQSYKTFKLVAKSRVNSVMKTHQIAPLRMIFDCKAVTLRRKARLVIGKWNQMSCCLI
jgi:hypothetical protein